MEPRVSGFPAHSLVVTPTELSLCIICKSVEYIKAVFSVAIFYERIVNITIVGDSL